MLMSWASVGLNELGVRFAAMVVEALIDRIARSFMHAERLEQFRFSVRICARQLKGVVGWMIARQYLALEWHYAVAVGRKLDWH